MRPKIKRISLEKHVLVLTIVALLAVIMTFWGLYLTQKSGEGYNESLPPPKYEKPTGYAPEIERYVSFLQSVEKINPVDYVMHLFETNDIVVFGEGHHMEMTQYDLLYNIATDKRFIEQSGLIITEVASQSINDMLHDYLTNSRMGKKEADRKLINICRDMTWQVYWEKSNFHDFISRIREFNKRLPDGQKISVVGADMPINWNEITIEEYRQVFGDTYGSGLDSRTRDRIMASFVSEQYKLRKESPSSRQKILVIMNTVHSFRLFDDGCSTMGYLAKAHPGTVANVMLNHALKLMDGGYINTHLSGLVCDGKWDAAFRYMGNPAMGFDFNGTPFGEDTFDFFGDYESVPNSVTYRRIYDGFIFYRPVEEHILKAGIQGYLDDEYISEFKRRFEIAGVPDLADVGISFFRAYDSPKEFRYEDGLAGITTDCNKMIERWLTY